MGEILDELEIVAMGLDSDQTAKVEALKTLLEHKRIGIRDDIAASREKRLQSIEDRKSEYRLFHVVHKSIPNPKRGQFQTIEWDGTQWLPVTEEPEQGR